MIPRELIEGVQKMLSAGAPREVVWDFLLERGWSEDDAEKVFASLGSKEPNTEKEVQKKSVEPRQEAATREPRVEKAEIKVLTEDSNEAQLPVAKTVLQAPEKSEKKNVPLVTVKKSEEERQVIPITKHKSEQKPTTPTAPPKVKVKEERGAPPEERKPEQKEKLAPKKRSRFLPVEEEDDEVEKAELFEMDRFSSPFRLMSTALSLVKQRFWNLFFLSFMISVLYLLLYIVLSYILTSQNVASVWDSVVGRESDVLITTSLLVVLTMAVGFVGAGLLLWLPAAFVLAFSGRTSSFRDLFMHGFKAGFSFFIAIIFVSLFVLSGSVLLLVPGVILSVWFIFAPIITVVERTSPFVSLLVSRELIRHHFWDVVLREAFLIIPVLLAAIVLLLLLTPLSLLDSLGLGVGLIVLIFVAFAAILFFFAFMLFFFAYHVALYKEMHAREQAIKLSSRLAGSLPFLLIIPLLLSLAVALYVSSLL